MRTFTRNHRPIAFFALAFGIARALLMPSVLAPVRQADQGYRLDGELTAG